MRIKRILVALFMFVFAFGIFTLPSQAAEDTLIYGTDGTITRAEWIHDLSILFNMQVDEDNYPDNYYSDLTVDSPYYADIMMAVEFGVIDLEAGKEFRPNDPADRDFVSYTLNYCLGFQVEPAETEGVFADVDSIEHLAAAKIAVDRNWLAISDGNFEPDVPATTAEITTMIQDAQELNAGLEIEENYENKYEFAEGVIVVPQTTSVELDADGNVNIYDTSVNIAIGDVFAVYVNEVPITYVAKTVVKNDNYIQIEVEEESDGITDADAQGIVDADLRTFVPAEDVDAQFISDAGMPMAMNARNAKAKGVSEINIRGIKVGSKKLPITVTVSNIVLSYKVKALQGYAMVKVNGDVKVVGKAEISADAVVPLGTLQVGGIGEVVVSAYIKMDGSIILTFTSGVEVGVEYANSKYRIINEFYSPTFSIETKVSMDVGIGIEARIKNIPCISAKLYAKEGVKTVLSSKIYGDGELPKECEHHLSYTYAEAGANASINIAGIVNKSFSKKFFVLDENNSPCRLSNHFEDGKLVGICTRNPKGWYYSKWNSHYGTVGSYGFDESGAIVPVYTYTLDKEGNATITGYTGRASVLNIPSEVDGHSVVAIGVDAFKGRNDIEVLNFPDDITLIAEGDSYL